MRVPPRRRLDQEPFFSFFAFFFSAVSLTLSFGLFEAPVPC